MVGWAFGEVTHPKLLTLWPGHNGEERQGLRSNSPLPQYNLSDLRLHTFSLLLSIATLGTSPSHGIQTIAERICFTEVT